MVGVLYVQAISFAFVRGSEKQMAEGHGSCRGE
jgi:hypothetical protein